MSSFGLSSICNIVAAVKTAKYLDLGPERRRGHGRHRRRGDVRERASQDQARDFPDGFDAVAAGEAFGRWMLGGGTDHLLETTKQDRERIFNLGYFTWVEQQGLSYRGLRRPAPRRRSGRRCGTSFRSGTR